MPPSPTGPVHRPSPAGPPPSQRNNTPLIIGILGAVAAAVLLVVLLSSNGGSDDDGDGDGGGGSAAGQNPVAQDDPAAQESPVAQDGPPADLDPQTVADGQALAQEFLDLVNGGDGEAAIAMLCQVGEIQEDIDAITDVAGDAALEMDPSTAEIVSQGVVYAVDLTGSVHGQSVSRAHVATAARDDCIVNFSASAG